RTADFLKPLHVPRSDFYAQSFTRLNVVHMPPAKPQTGCSSSSENKTSDSPTSPTFTLSKVRLIKAPLSSTVDTSYRISHSPSSHELLLVRDSSRASRGLNLQRFFRLPYRSRQACGFFPTTAVHSRPAGEHVACQPCAGLNRPRALRSYQLIIAQSSPVAIRKRRE